MENLQSEKDRVLWKQAKKRVGFKNHLFTYLIINVMVWVLWLLDGRPVEEENNFIPWPVFCSLGWGFGLFWHYMATFVFSNKPGQVEKEYEKLKNRQA